MTGFALSWVGKDVPDLQATSNSAAKGAAPRLRGLLTTSVGSNALPTEKVDATVQSQSGSADSTSAVHEKPGVAAHRSALVASTYYFDFRVPAARPGRPQVSPRPSLFLGNQIEGSTVQRSLMFN